MAKIGILGAGSWANAIALLLSDNGHSVTVWSALPEEIEVLKKTHRHKAFDDVHLPETIDFTADLREASRDKEILVLAVPSIYTRSTARLAAPFLKKGQILLNVAKGIEEDTLMLLTQQIEQETQGANICVLSGPSHAEEVARRLPTTCVVGAGDAKTAEYIQNIFMSHYFRVYTSSDLVGIEVGGALKNVIALAAGIADGLGYGDNTKAALITRGIVEISRLGVKMGGSLESFYGLSGIGDLIVTCASMHSRNRRAGILIGKGYSMEKAMEEVGMVVEGVYSVQAAFKLSRRFEVEMPIVSEIRAVLFDGKDPKVAVDSLMRRERIIENHALQWDKLLS